jgi:signal transduction histidine kinase/PAS domain-containing protein
MNTPSFPSFSNHEVPPQAAAPDAGQRQAPPPGQHSRKPWFGLIHWIQENSFAPQWLPEPLRHPLIGYLAALLIELAAMSPLLLLLSLFPTFSFYQVFTLVGVVLVALGWGAGPGLVATMLSTLLLEFVVLSPYFTWTIDDPADVIGLVLYLVVGASISLLAGRSEWARRQAVESAHLLRQAETQSRFESQRLRTVLDVLPAAVLITGPQGQLLEMNQATRTLWGGDIASGTNLTQYPQDSAWKGRTHQPIAYAGRPLLRALSGGQAVLNEEFEIEALDGKRKMILNSAAPIRDESGSISGAVICAQDISELRRLERVVSERAQELEAIFETMTDGVFVFDAEGHITRLNAAGRQIRDPAAAYLTIKERVASHPPLDEKRRPIPLEQIPSVRILHGEVLTGAKTADFYLPTPQGRLLAYNTSGTPLYSADGTITGAVVVTRDVTERRRLEREVSERAQELEAIFEAITDGIAVLDDQGRLVSTNNAFRTLHGVEHFPDFLTLPLEKRLAMLALADEQGQPLAVEGMPFSRLFHGETLTPGVDINLKTLAGCNVVLNVGGAPIRDQLSQVTGCVLVFRDVTARQHLEQRTREILGAFVAMAEAMVQIRPGTLSVEASDEAVTGPAANVVVAAVARRLAELTRSVLRCRRVSISAVNAASGQLAPVAEVGLHRWQEESWWASWSPPQHLEERYGQAIAARLYAGESVQVDTRQLPERFQYILYGAESGRIVPMRLGEELVGILLVDYQEPEHDYATAEEMLLTQTLARLGALVLEQDRLLRGWAEARANELALYETKAQMDTFLGIASHELKTPLTSLKLSLQVAERRLRKVTREKNGEPAGTDPGLQPAVEQLTRTAQQVERLSRLVNDLVDVSRIQAGKLELRLDDADVVEIVRAVVEEQEQAAPERTIRLLCPADLSVPASVDAGRVEQVVTNYLTNALKYSPEDRPVDLGLEVEPEQVRVWVHDQGPGLSLSDQEDIWERFHQVKDVEVHTGVGVGLGLGLYISRIIVERHRGQVGVQSTLGGGSTFWFTLPLPGPADVER